MDTDHDSTPKPGRTEAAAATQLRQVILGQWIVIAVLSVAVVVGYTAFFRLTDCVERYSKQNYDAQTVRLAVAEAERKSLAEVFDAIVASDEARIAREITEHQELLVRNDKVRAANPYPDLPKSC